jgi:hypothetical protein
MKTTISIHDAAFILLTDEYGSWTREEAFALAQYYEQLEEDLGEEIELDVVAIRCEWNSYSNMQEVRDNYPTCPEDDDDALEWLYDCAQVIVIDDEALLVTEF